LDYKLAQSQNDDILRENLNLKLNYALAGALIACCCHNLTAAESNVFSLDSAGARFGFAATHAARGFRAGEGFLNCNLPVSWELGNSSFSVKMRMDFTGGWLGREGLNAATSSVGPAFVLQHDRVPLALELGSSSTLISRHDFGSENLGGPFQFTTHVGLTWDIARHWRLGYRYEHISNAGLYAHNPGVGLHAFSLGYVF
jgi:hypothetical protein